MCNTSLVYLIAQCNTSTEIWQSLHEHFEQSNSSSMYHLLSRMFDLQLKEGDDLQSHLKTFTELCQELEAIELEIPEPIKVTALLKSLPSSFTMLRTSLQMKGDDLRLNEVIQALTTEDQQRQGKRTQNNDYTESAMRLNRGRGRGNFPRRYNTNRRGSWQNDRGNSSSQFSGNCYNCGKFGHMAVHCRKTVNYYCDTSQKNNEADARNESSNEELLKSVFANDNEEIALNTTSDVWVIDSGASCHMTSDKTRIEGYNQFKELMKVNLGDNKSINAYGEGQVKLRVQLANGKMSTVILKDVLYVPTLAGSLLSVRAAADKAK